jgi:Flp pilus assembly protein TadG
MVKSRWRLARAACDCDGAAAVEFALLAPAMLLLFAGIVGFSFVLSTYSALQEVASDAARAAIAGLTASQQAQYASQYVFSAIGSYSFIDPTQVTVATSATASTFQVTVSYNASNSFFSNLPSAFISSPVIIRRSATVQLSGF